MNGNAKVLESIFAVIDATNAELPGNRRLQKSAETILFGQGAALDSLGLVSFVLAMEQKIARDFGIALSLTDERAMSQQRSPFRTIGTLADYIGQLLQRSDNG